MADHAKTDRRDRLAQLRTDLANERTLLAYTRTSMMSAGSGLTMIKFFADLPWANSVGVAFLAMGAILALVGLVRFARMRASVRN